MEPEHVGLDLCPACFDFMIQMLPQVEQIIAEAGILESCADLCVFFQEKPEEMMCNLACDTVGIRTFVDLINVTDPSPVFICQQVDLCPEVAGGEVNVTKCYADPKAGVEGTIFNFYLEYSVTSPTGPGMFVVEVFPADNSTSGVGYYQFTEGQEIGTYDLEWQVQATPSEQEPFSRGVYVGELAVCAGDCSNDHTYSGVYGSGTTFITVTN